MSTKLRVVSLFLVLVSTSAVPGAAQRIVPAIDETMKCFRDSPPSIPQSQCPEGVVPVEYVVFGWRTFEEASVDGVARRLLELVNAADINTRNRAATMLGILGAEVDGSPGHFNAIAYMQEGYDRTQFDGVRRSLVDMASVASDTLGAVAFLSRVLQDPSTRGGGSYKIGKVAALGLTRLGSTGIAELQRLDSIGLQDEETSAWVRRHVRRGSGKN